MVKNKIDSKSKGSLWLPAIFSDNMMLQAGKENLLWGKTKPGEKVVVKIAGKIITGRADKLGRFKVNLPEMKPGLSCTMEVASGKSIRIKNILVGDIWLASGQSNMEMTVNESKDAVIETKAAKYPKIRIFTVKKQNSFEPLEDVSGNWSEVTPETIGKFSAVGYFFGRELFNKINIPIGIINSSYGGTKVEWWMSPEAIKNAGKTEEAIAQIKAEKKKTKKVPKKKLQAFPESGLYKDTGNTGYSAGFALSNANEAEWKPIKAPGFWNLQGHEYVGAVWLRKKIRIPEKWKGLDLVLDLGPVVDFDTTYFNNEKVGFSGTDDINSWTIFRKYLVPALHVREGVNVISVRVFAHNKNGGLHVCDGGLKIYPANKQDLGQIELKGRWLLKAEKKLPQIMNGNGGAEITPMSLYNAMLKPVVGFGIKGFIWYQGESNADKPGEYAGLMENFISDLRQKWGSVRLPFYFVQIANFGVEAGPNWPGLREAQTKNLGFPYTGMACAIDIGDSRDIHPKNKQEVGRRLALWALAKDYGKNMEYSGPMCKFVKLEGKSIVVTFSHSQALKVVGDKSVKGFELAEKNGMFVPAAAKIRNNTVIVSAKGLKKPVYVRYAWSADPVCNLFNADGLPAVPFREKV